MSSAASQHIARGFGWYALGAGSPARSLSPHTPRRRALPVVILTSSKEDADIIQGYSLGVNSYIGKPVDFEQFVAVVAELGMYWLVLNQASAPFRWSVNRLRATAKSFETGAVRDFRRNRGRLSICNGARSR
jgi:response regulator RpfG family c-di-GMP phosphodiesterase